MPAPGEVTGWASIGYRGNLTDLLPDFLLLLRRGYEAGYQAMAIGDKQEGHAEPFLPQGWTLVLTRIRTGAMVGQGTRVLAFTPA